MRKKLFFAFVASCAMAVNAQIINFDETMYPEQGGFAVGDIDNDGDLDVIFSGRDYEPTREVGAIMLNNGDGTFVKQAIEDADRVIRAGHFADIKLGDIDGDGDMDVIFNGNDGAKTGIAINDGKGNFTLADKAKYPWNSATIACGFADLNNDGLLDYYFFGNGKGAGINALYLQQSDGSFAQVSTSFDKMQFTDPNVTVIDFNKDGYLDIFLNGYLENADAIDGYKRGRFSAVFLNDGKAGFTVMEQPNLVMKGYGAADWTDVDGDGWLDLLLVGHGMADVAAGPVDTEDKVLRIYKNNQGTLEAKGHWANYDMLGANNRVKFIDWDNDGDMDFIAPGFRKDEELADVTDFFICKDVANFTFERNTELSNNELIPRMTQHVCEVADLDKDGKADLLVMGWSPNYGRRRFAGYAKNNSENVSTLPVALTNLDAAVAGHTVTFTWEVPADLQGKPGISYNLSLYNKTAGKWMYNPMAVVGGENNGWRKVTGLGNVSTNTSWKLTLPDGEYEWTVQAINGAYLGGAFAETKTFTVGEGQGTAVENVTVQSDVLVRDNILVVKAADAEDMTVAVYAINGAKVLEQAFVNNAEIALAQGAYLVEVRSAGKTPYRTKVIMQ